MNASSQPARRLPAIPPLPSEGRQIPTSKPCSTCREVLPAGSFGRDHRSSSGLRSQCRYCEQSYDAARGGRRNSEARVR